MTPTAVQRGNWVGGGSHLRKGAPELPFERWSSNSDHKRERRWPKWGQVLGTGR